MKRLPTTVGLLAAGLVFATAADGQYRLTISDLAGAGPALTSLTAAKGPAADFAFALARNNEIEASIAVYQAARVAAFSAERNAEIDASVQAYAAQRDAVRKAEIAAADAIYDAQLEAAFEFDRNAEAEASIAAYEKQRYDEMLFAATRNAELEVSVSRVKYVREQETAFHAARQEEIERSIAAYEANRRQQFIAERNAEIETSIAAYEAERRSRFASERNAEIARSVAIRGKIERDEREFAAARTAEIEASVAAYQQARERAFAAARNAEATASILAYNRQRAVSAAVIAIAPSSGNRSTAYVPVAARVAEVKDTCRSFAAAPEAVRFARASARFDKSVVRALDQVATLARKCPGLEIEIRGYTDASGSATRNRKLSERRATAAARYLTDAGVGTTRVSAVGMGETAPIAPNDTVANRALNRRIEFAFRLKPSSPTLAADASR